MRPRRFRSKPVERHNTKHPKTWLSFLVPPFRWGKWHSGEPEEFYKESASWRSEGKGASKFFDALDLKITLLRKLYFSAFSRAGRASFHFGGKRAQRRSDQARLLPSPTGGRQASA